MIMRFEDAMERDVSINKKKMEMIIMREKVQNFNFLWGEIFLIISNIINNIIF